MGERPGRPSVDPAVLGGTTGAIPVIVQKRDPADRSIERAVRALGGRVTRPLPIVDGFSATLPASSVRPLADLGGIRAISLDRKATLQQTAPGTGPPSVYPQVVGATAMAASGYTGRGVTVALVDTGVADSPDLSGRVLPVYDDLKGTYSPCLNLTSEPDCSDSYGHGTFLAGIIAGSGASSGGTYAGVAPQANLVSVKIAGSDGSADVTHILAAIQWVVTFKDRYNIRVLNLSLGTDSTQSYTSDPLNYAVERAWAAGIVVVVSASNRGPDYRTIAKPGDDPWVITVGATDDMGTVDYFDDELPDFSSRGPALPHNLAKPDLVAPGAHLVSLRSQGSAIDQAFPFFVDGAYRRGSGTSMSAAVVSGVAALLVQADPTIVPDRVKFALASTARQVASTDPLEVGSGLADAYRAAFFAPEGLANQGLSRSTGKGKLDRSRGSLRIQADDRRKTVVSGDWTAQLERWSAHTYSGEWTGAKWYGAKWYGAKWYGAKWYGARWYGAKWYGAKWYGMPDGAKWYGYEFEGAK